MKAGLIILGVLLLGALLIGGTLVSTRNELVTQQESVRAQFSQVDVVLQRRADLIPNLVETVKGYAKQEKEIFENIANARAAYTGARNTGEKIAANERLEGALGRLLVITENYPQLKSNENFQRLQDELSGTENRIAQERRRYNEAVQRYNTNLNLFPNNMVAGMFGFQREEPFRVNPAQREAPKVSF